ncbi:MAG: tRNA lysidine(34) synthetase TilS [Chitinophagales bacterium]|nr:tRNA lysidine(34) synthetase TilS [Chitinophagales bacterium]
MNKNQTLLQKFIEHNTSKRLANRKKKTLLAVSGGIDSVVMCSLFHQAKFPFAIAHCNFQLRGNESNGDEALVVELGKKYGVEVFVNRFDTKQYAQAHTLSIQLAARQLRYQWFEELRKEKDFNLIATAHQLNDNIETILFNLTKGTGIRGLRGIPVRQNNIVRPLLFATREEIEAYQKENNTGYREDSSNAEDKYTRNKIRHHIIPLLKEINPGLEETLASKIEVFTELELLYEKEIAKRSAQLFLKKKGDVIIPLLKLKKTKSAASVLYEYLKDFGFNGEQCNDMVAAIDAEAGKQFLSPTARLIKDRKHFILTPLTQQQQSVQVINEGDTEIKFANRTLKLSPAAEVKPDKSVAYIDKTKLEYPLLVRPWAAGDYFYPFGMKMKKKKLKKFLTDEKVPVHEKENIWVIESNKKIAWVIGYRIDDRFKVTTHTKDTLKVIVV